MDIFDFVMEKEKLAAECYHQLADNAPTQGVKHIFEMLAVEEQRHIKVVEQMKQSISTEVAHTTVLSDAKDVFQKMQNSTENFDFSITEPQMYQKARDAEKQSMDYYLEKAAQADDPLHKEIFTKLADQEKKHFVLMQNIIDFVSRPQTWLENAEFTHLEEY